VAHIPKKITADFIKEVLSEKRPESRTLEYKRDLPGKSNTDKTEFCKNVSAFANTEGGCILYGIQELEEDGRNTGKPERVVSLRDLNADQERLRLEQILRDGVEPRLPGVHIQPVEGLPEGPALAVVVPRSWMAPHMVTHGGHNRFYSRAGGGKYQLDVKQLRDAFARSEEIPLRIRRFRDERLATIQAGDTPVPLPKDAKLIMHLVPLASIVSVVSLDMNKIMEEASKMRLFDMPGSDTRFNLDGVLTYYRGGSGNLGFTYAQFFRTGCVEAVLAKGLEPELKRNPLHQRNDPSLKENLLVSDGSKLSRLAVDMLERLMGYLKTVGPQPPVYLFVTLMGFRDSVLLFGGIDGQIAGNPDDYLIDGDVLVLPEIQLDDLDAPADTAIKPALDALWQASGYANCPCYDNQGNFRARPQNT